MNSVRLTPAIPANIWSKLILTPVLIFAFTWAPVAKADTQKTDAREKSNCFIAHGADDGLWKNCTVSMLEAAVIGLGISDVTIVASQAASTAVSRMTAKYYSQRLAKFYTQKLITEGYLNAAQKAEIQVTEDLFEAGGEVFGTESLYLPRLYAALTRTPAVIKNFVSDPTAVVRFFRGMRWSTNMSAAELEAYISGAKHVAVKAGTGAVVGTEAGAVAGPLGMSVGFISGVGWTLADFAIDPIFRYVNRPVHGGLVNLAHSASSEGNWLWEQEHAPQRAAQAKRLAEQLRLGKQMYGESYELPQSFINSAE